MREFKFPPPPYRIVRPSEPVTIYIIAPEESTEEAELVRMSLSFHELGEDDKGREKRRAIASLFEKSARMAHLLDDLSEDDRIPEDRKREINTILDEIEGK